MGTTATRCEQLIIRRHSAGNVDRCNRETAGECVRCHAQLCDDHTKICERCGGRICNDYFCSFPHDVECRSVLATLRTTIGELETIVERRMSPELVE